MGELLMSYTTLQFLWSAYRQIIGKIGPAGLVGLRDLRSLDTRASLFDPSCPPRGADGVRHGDLTQRESCAAPSTIIRLPTRPSTPGTRLPQPAFTRL